MPQMSPLPWLNLFTMFSSTFLIFMTLNYFMKVPTKVYLNKPSLIKYNVNWKW